MFPTRGFDLANLRQGLEFAVVIRTWSVFVVYGTLTTLLETSA